MSDLVSCLLAKLDEKQREYEELVRDPFEGMSDDELHQRHAHRAYEYATTEGQRKAWDDDMTPPWDHELNRHGDGWELNITSADPEAWERFDYHEERYWRRLRPDGPSEWVPDEEAVHGLRLCQAHRDVIDMYQQADAARGKTGPSPMPDLDHASAMGRLTALGLVVQTLARAYEVEPM